MGVAVRLRGRGRVTKQQHTCVDSWPVQGPSCAVSVRPLCPGRKDGQKSCGSKSRRPVD